MRVKRFYYERLRQKRDLIRDLKWQILEKAFRFLTTIFVSLLISKYLSPEDFGKYTYVISIFTIWINASGLGISNLIVAQISKFKINQKKIISTFLRIRIISNIIVFVVFLIYSLFSLKLGLFLLFSIFFSFLDVFEYYNQGTLRLSNNAKAKIVAYFFGFILKVIAILYFKSFALALVFYGVEFSFAYFLIYKYSRLDFFEIILKKVDSKLQKATFKKMLPLSITPILTILTTKLDVLIIKSKFGFSLLGEYHIFSQVIMLWTIFPVMLSNYYLPRLAQIYCSSKLKYQEELRKYMRIYFFIGLFLTLFALIVFHLQYKFLNYQNNSIYIAGIILCFTNITTSTAILQNQIIAINNLHIYSLIKVFVLFLIMISSSLFFVDYIGIIALPISMNLALIFVEFILPKFFNNTIRSVI
tara:strand:+ start:7284 stop:8531 length:1248 start_codon:yes stop_codon:yes gene_type:complete